MGEEVYESIALGILILYDLEPHTQFELQDSRHPGAFPCCSFARPVFDIGDAIIKCTMRANTCMRQP